LAGALPQFHLKQAVLRHDKALREEEIVLVLRVNVGDPPMVALHTHGIAQPMNIERSANLRDGGFRPCL
jgi:hypothetical protein